jgi:NADPH:quinone reductase-like Zn-dependent oxidoreductase
MAAPIPGGMKYEDAAVLPLGLSTAACGLFEKDHLALQYPSSKPTPTGKTVLIWGGSTSVGSNAIQLAVASGYEVITTASPVNFDYVKKLGASEVFDYKSKTVVQDIIEAFKARIIAGALAIGAGSSKPCLDIVHASKGAKFVSLASAPMSFDRAPIPRKISWLIPIAAQMVATNVSLTLDAWMKGIKTNFIFATSLMWNEVGRMIYVDFLPSALADGTYKTAPEPLVVGEGLDQILTGLAIQKNGVSAKKVVIKL